MKQIAIKNVAWNTATNHQTPAIDAEVAVGGQLVDITLAAPDDPHATQEWVPFGNSVDMWCSDPRALDDEQGEIDRTLADEVVCRVSDEAVRRGFTREA